MHRKSTFGKIGLAFRIFNSLNLCTCRSGKLVMENKYGFEFRMEIHHDLRCHQIFYLGVGDARRDSRVPPHEPRIVPLHGLPSKPTNSIRVVCLSDTHGWHDWYDLPPSDVFVHCGDILYMGLPGERGLREFGLFLLTVPSRHKLISGGNHDRVLPSLDDDEKHLLFPESQYLEYSGVIVDGVKFFSFPWSPKGGSGNKVCWVFLSV